MTIHGTYRGIYSKLVDDPEFQCLTSEARHTFLTMRVMPEIGPGAIWRAYLEPIAHRTGYTVKKIETVLDELASRGWIRWDGVILWIVNGLHHDPTVKLTDIKHQKGVLRSLAGLPKRQIVLSFCDYYNLPRPFDAPSETHNEQDQVVSPNPNPNPNPKKTESESEHTLSSPSHSNGLDWALFDQLWDMHPGNKGSKEKAKQEFKRVHPPKDVCDRFAAQIANKQACDRRNMFHPEFPFLARWLKERRWDTEIPLPIESTAQRLWREAQEEKRAT